MRAIIFSHSNLRRDPRILRQVTWLKEYGFSEIVTVGCGKGIDGVKRHYKISVFRPLRRYFGYLIRNPKTRFYYFFGKQLAIVPPSEISRADLLVVNEVEYIPWLHQLSHEIDYPPTYLDLHEDHVNDAHRSFLEMLAFKSFWHWQNSHLPLFVTQLKAKGNRIIITTVEEEIGKLYSSLLNTNVEIILNSPAWNSLRPTPVDPKHIKLVHHGFGTKGRGIETILYSLSNLDKRFTLELILFMTPLYRIKLMTLRYFLGLRARVQISHAVPLDQLFSRLNQYDVAVIILSQKVPGHLNSLPNKFFESLHAKLAIVSGPNPTMSKLISEGGFGVVAPDWSSVELTRVLESLTDKQIASMKEKSVDAARVFSSSRSQAVFMNILERLIS
jgi:hypothetical protein